MSDSTLVRRADEAAAGAAVTLVDCDIHNAVPSTEALYPYLSARWRRYAETVGSRVSSGQAADSLYPKAAPKAARLDAWPPKGIPGSDLGFMRAHHLDPLGIDHGLLNPLYPAASQINPEWAAALSSAVNDWQRAEWTEPEPRLRASVVVPYESPEEAAREVRRVGAEPGFVQVLMLVRTRAPLGDRRYWPIYEAAAELDLPVAIHFGGTGGNPITPVGWPSYYLEDHTVMGLAHAAHLVSLVLGGALERFPSLRVVMMEGGFGWLPSLCWRLDAAYRRIREDVGSLPMRPSEYVARSVWATSQPMEEPPVKERFRELFSLFDFKHRLLFATDYPHWDYDDPAQAFPTRLEPAVRQRVMSGNALELYRF